MIKISYILPFYNVEKYIGECIDSCYQQNMPEDEFEVICVNDASPDCSRDVVLQKQREHTNIELVEQPYNQHMGIARNRGVEEAKGEYIWYVDTDDVIATNKAKSLYEVAHAKRVDVLIFNFASFVDGTNDYKQKYQLPSTCGEVMTGEEYIDRYHNSSLAKLSPVWHNIYRREYLIQNGLKQTDLKRSEDAPFAWEALLQSNRVCCVDIIGYLYRDNQYSMTSRPITGETAFVVAISYPVVLVKTLQRVTTNLQSVKIRHNLSNAIVSGVRDGFCGYYALSKTERKKFVSLLKNAKDVKVLLFPYLNRRQKMIYRLRQLPFSLFNLVMFILKNDNS